MWITFVGCKSISKAPFGEWKGDEGIAALMHILTGGAVSLGLSSFSEGLNVMYARSRTQLTYARSMLRGRDDGISDSNRLTSTSRNFHRQRVKISSQSRARDI
ncbi:hypothetical protein SAY87_012436 [Trapa incisa]|uniref:Uncharacterized protein n=1 Tax=Trapa incisa TaxID=236973 RepID=A0AAN7JIW1_9MYRT|nr:hypothetical protein SAY87_012436 [Trapa incisa]